MSPCRRDYIFIPDDWDVWRIVSEDSDELLAGLAVVHGLRDLRNPDKPSAGLMLVAVDHFHASGKLLKVALLCCSHRILPEERNDHMDQIISLSDNVSEQILFMVIVPLT